jgi:hypothetical protein
MKITPFGFVTQTEGFLREALSLPPTGGGKWSLQRVINFADQAGALQVMLEPETGPQKVKMTFHARQTGSFKDSGIQGWIEFNEGEKDPFVLKQSNSDRAAQEIFSIVDRALTRLPEWDNAATRTAPPPPPRAGTEFEPLISKKAPEEPSSPEASPSANESAGGLPTVEENSSSDEPAKKAKATKSKKAAK